MTPILLVDGHNLLYRAWFGFPARIRARSSSRDLTGVFGFTALLRKAQREYAADHEVVVVFDSETSATARMSIDPSYKADRVIADHTPMESYADVTRILDLAGVRWIEHPAAEADDVIAALTTRAVDDRRTVTVMSCDKDFYQLLATDLVRQLDTRRAAAHRLIDATGVRCRFGVRPDQWPDFRALTGDVADGIPGIRGIGPITAARLLAGDRGLDDLRPRCAVDRHAAVRRAVEHWDDVLRWRSLIRLDARAVVPEELVSGRATPTLLPAAALLEVLDLW